MAHALELRTGDDLQVTQQWFFLRLGDVNFVKAVVCEQMSRSLTSIRAEFSLADTKKMFGVFKKTPSRYRRCQTLTLLAQTSSLLRSGHVQSNMPQWVSRHKGLLHQYPIQYVKFYFFLHKWITAQNDYNKVWRERVVATSGNTAFESWMKQRPCLHHQIGQFFWLHHNCRCRHSSGLM